MSHIIPLIFISWSRPLSKDVAIALKEFLYEILDLHNKARIFVSYQNLTGNDRGWFEEILKKASAAPIIIPCVTADSVKSPWLHFETGIGSCQRANCPTKVIPFLYNFSISEMGENMGMYKYHQMISSDLSHAEDVYYHDILCQLIYSVNTYLAENKKYINEYFAENVCIHDFRDDYDKNLIYKKFKDSIDKTTSLLKLLTEKYSTREFYFSRPIRGVAQSVSEDYESALAEMSKEAEFRSFKSYFGQKTNKLNSFGLSFSQMGVIKSAHYFVFIYPKIEEDNIAPSSCLIELGGALAYNKAIVLFIQKGANMPAFVTDLIALGHFYREYNDIAELKRLWVAFLDSMKNDK